MTRLDREARVTIKTLVSRGTTNTGVARLLGVTEGSVRYHVSRMVTGTIDSRGMKPFKAAPQAEAIEHWRQSQLDGALNLAALHTWLVGEHGYDGSLRSVQRFWAKHYPAPAIRARRRVETPPGVQAQADWAHFPQVVIEAVEAQFGHAGAASKHRRYAGSRRVAGWPSAPPGTSPPPRRDGQPDARQRSCSAARRC